MIVIKGTSMTQKELQEIEEMLNGNWYDGYKFPHGDHVWSFTLLAKNQKLLRALLIRILQEIISREQL